jgi:hypothetical protein
MTQHRRARPIAEKHTSISIGPVGDRRQLISADHQGCVISPRSNELLRDLNPEQKSSARGRNIEAGGIFGANFFLNETGGRRKNHVGSGGGDEKQIDFFGGNFRLLDCFERGLRCHVAGHFVFGGNAPFLDPGARRDPLVAGIDHAREIFVSKNFLRRITTGADN